MEKNILENLQEILFSSSDQRVSRQIAKLERMGRIRKIAPRVYSSNLVDPPEEIIRRNLLLILGRLYADAVLSHRSAFECRPTETGHIFITHTYTKKIPLPGVTLRFLEGKGPLEGDSIISGGLYVSQTERGLLENLQISRRSGPQAKSLGADFVKERLQKIVEAKGDVGLNEVRMRAQELSRQMGLEEEYAKLEALIDRMLETRPAEALSNPVQMARTFGHTYDPARQTVFETLFSALRNEEFPDLPDRNATRRSLRNSAFFDTYYSFLLEGIDLDFETALAVSSADRAQPDQDEVWEDFLQAHRLVSNRMEMSRIPASPSGFLELQQQRHQAIFMMSVLRQPGRFRGANSQGAELFLMDHHLVKGTLERGFEYYNALRHPLAKGIYVHFLIIETQPFLSGNGLLARTMLNAELVRANQSRIFFPPTAHAEYTMAMRKLSRQQEPMDYIRLMQRLHMFSAGIYGEDLEGIHRTFFSVSPSSL